MKDKEPTALQAWKKGVKDGDAPEGALIRKWFNAGIEKAGIDESARTVTFVISTASPDRDNDTIAVEGWQLDNYKKNPVVLWAHDSRSLPVARSLEVAAFGGSLKSVAQFATRDEYPYADTVFRLLVGGYLNATSVGFLPIKYEVANDRGNPDSWWPPIDFLEQELLEYSVVPVPANPEALIDAKSKGIDTMPLIEWAVRTLDEGWTREGELMLPQGTVERVARIVSGKSVSGPTPAPEAKTPPGELLDLKAKVEGIEEKLDALIGKLDEDESPPAPDTNPDEPPSEEGDIELEDEESEDDLDLDVTADQLREMVDSSVKAALAAAAGRLPD